jgi:DNA-binding IclR family transcriptional regulator
LPQEAIRLSGSPDVSALPTDYRTRLADIRKTGIDHAFDAPVPGIGTLAAPVFDHTGSIRLVIALIGSSENFDGSPQGGIAQQLLAATQRFSWRFGWISGS